MPEELWKFVNELTWGTFSDWHAGEEPRWPQNPDAKYYTILISTNGLRMCFAYSSYEAAKQSYDGLVKMNEDNPRCEGAICASKEVLCPKVT